MHYDGITYPLINETAIPYAYSTSSLSKRIKLAGHNFAPISTSFIGERPAPSIRSASPLGHSFPAQSRTSQGRSDQSLNRACSSLPPAKSSRASRQSADVESGKIVQETFQFPEKQIWVQPRPRNRRQQLAAKISQTADSPHPPKDAGEPEDDTLVLGKDSAKIAALIAQKRKNNEARLFRERMRRRQRLHHGTTEEDRLIVASHDKLRRKMELSAKGVFEEKTTEPNNILAVRSISNVHMVDDALKYDTSPVVHDEQVAGSGKSSNNVQALLQAVAIHDADMQTSIESPEIDDSSTRSDFSRDISRGNHSHVPVSLCLASTTMSTFQPVQSYEAQSESTMRALSRVLGGELLPAAPNTRSWSSNLWQATPIVRSNHTPCPEEPPIHQHTMTENLESRGSVNMFTGQARENGVIGGNNNWIESAGEKRQNMFSRRA